MGLNEYRRTSSHDNAYDGTYTFTHSNPNSENSTQKSLVLHEHTAKWLAAGAPADWIAAVKKPESGIENFIPPPCPPDHSHYRPAHAELGGPSDTHTPHTSTHIYLQD